MSRRAVLWMAFAIVHVVVAWLGFVLPNIPMGDVYLVYEPWALDAVNGRQIVGIDSAWIYPQLAIVPIVLALGLEWIAGYEIAWALLVTLADAAVFALLVGRARSTGRRAAAWFWLGFILLLGPVGMYRLDAITVPLAIAGCLWLVGRPLLGSILLSVATWIKVWPAALLAAALIAVRRRGALLAGVVIVTAFTAIVVVAAGGAPHLLGFVSGQTDRGIQVEAPIAALYLWQAVAGVPDAFVYYDRDILTFQVTGAGIDAVVAVMTPVLIVVMLALAALGAIKTWRGASFAALFAPLSFAFVLGFIVFNKVGSPQYLTWLIPPVVAGIVVQRRAWLWAAVGSLIAAGLTQIVYPLIYHRVIAADALAAGVLTLRNALLIALFVWAVVCVARVRTGTRHPLSSIPDPEVLT